MNLNQSIIQKTRQAWMMAERRLAAILQSNRADREQALAEVKLVLDDMQAEGLTLETPLGREVFARIVSERKMRQEDVQYESESSLGKGWPDGY